MFQVLHERNLQKVVPNWWLMLDVLGVISPILAVSGGAGVALYIHWRRRKDSRAEMVKSKADAHKELWYALRQMEVQSKRPGLSGKSSPHEMENPYDIHWLRDHFRKNASLLSSELHDEYHALLEKDIRTVFEDNWKFNMSFSPSPNRTSIEGEIKKQVLMGADFTRMQNVAKKEWLRWEGEYKKMGGLDLPSE